MVSPDRQRGMLLGLAVGDALGAAYIAAPMQPRRPSGIILFREE
jgi:hypothetical protein